MAANPPPPPAPATEYSNEDAKALMEKLVQVYNTVQRTVNLQQTLGQFLDIETPEHMAPDPDNPGEQITVAATSVPPQYLGAPAVDADRLKCYNHCRAEFHEVLEGLKALDA